MTSISKGAFLVLTASLVALLVGSTSGIGGVHITFAANKSINVQTDINQDQGCEPAGGTSGITNACTATSVRGPTETPVTFNCLSGSLAPFTCNVAACNNIGCTSISCDFNIRNCTTNNGVQLTSCTARLEPMTAILSCTETGTGIINSGGVTRDDAG